TWSASRCCCSPPRAGRATSHGPSCRRKYDRVTKREGPAKASCEVRMQRVTRDRLQYVFDRHPAPVLRVAPGEVFEVETEDARTGKTRTPQTTTAEYVKSLRSKGTYYGNPVTGPVWVEGASP